MTVAIVLLALALATPNLTPPPGAIKPQLTQANIAQTICVPGWTRSVRPPATYTEPLKRKQIAERHYSDTNPRDYEEDHFVPLEIGGHPTDPRNLWPQPIMKERMKDKLEQALNKAVCGRKMTLVAAQQCLMYDGWIACAKLAHSSAITFVLAEDGA